MTSRDFKTVKHSRRKKKRKNNIKPILITIVVIILTTFFLALKLLKRENPDVALDLLTKKLSTENQSTRVAEPPAIKLPEQKEERWTYLECLELGKCDSDVSNKENDKTVADLGAIIKHELDKESLQRSTQTPQNNDEQLQCGAFSNENNAKLLSDKLIELGHNPSIEYRNNLNIVNVSSQKKSNTALFEELKKYNIVCHIKSK